MPEMRCMIEDVCDTSRFHYDGSWGHIAGGPATMKIEESRDGKTWRERPSQL